MSDLGVQLQILWHVALALVLGGAIVTGVAFLGAGTIFRRRASDQVEGLTTAASLLMSAAVGISVALDQIALALGVTALTLVVLWGLRILERRIGMKDGA